MFSKLKALSKSKTGSQPNRSISSIKKDLCDGLFNVMNESFQQRKSDSENSKFTPKDIDNIISGYARKNMIIAAASSIVPGPFGILGAVPELLMNFKNQMGMMYDLGCANGKEKFINRDILLDIPISVFGGNTNLSAIQNNPGELVDSPESILMEKSIVLGQSIIDRTLKKSVIQFIPVAGPILMGTWAKMTTAKISKESLQFLNDQETFTDYIKPKENNEIKRLLQIEKIKGLVNLIEANYEINENEIEFMKAIIGNSDLTAEEKAYFMQESLKIGSNFKLDKDLLTQHKEGEDLLMQLVVMAKRDGVIDGLEKKCIYSTGIALGIDIQFVNELF